jgi:hypothetical protein
MHARVRAVAVVALVAFTSSAASSIGVAAGSKDDKKACIASSEKAQQLRADGKLLAAREELLVCARDVCPGVIRKDCAKWLGELEDALPSIVLGAKDGKGHDLEDVRVSIDGAQVTATLDGKAVPIDPGPHALLFQHTGSPDVEDKIVVREGEKNRFVTVKIHVAGDDVPDASTTSGDGAGASTEAPKKIPTASWILGGVGVAALGSFAFFGLKGKSDESSLRSSCAPACADSDVSAVHTKYVIADVSLVVSVASLGVAAYLYFSQPRTLEAPKTTTSSSASLVPRFDVKVDAHGGFAVLGGSW